MRSLGIAIGLLAPFLASVPVSAGSGEERWIASSTTARSITGDIRLSPTHLKAAGVDFPLKVAADLASFEGDFGPVAARVLEVTRAMDPKLLHGNILGCGGAAVRWIVVWRRDGGGELGLDTFRGARAPHSVKAAEFCGSYFYTRP